MVIILTRFFTKLLQSPPHNRRITEVRLFYAVVVITKDVSLCKSLAYSDYPLVCLVVGNNKVLLILFKVTPHDGKCK